MTYVSRAGEKLEHALTVFKFTPQELVCADFGSSTGGFVDCLLRHEVKKVYAVETGYGIVDYKLRTDPRVIIMERKNAMHVLLPEKVDFISIDTSWTRLEHVLPNALKNLLPKGHIITLVKPHYEATRRILRKGKLPDENIPEVLEKVKNKIKNLGLEILAEIESPLVGEKGKNREFLFFIKSRT